MSDLLDEIRGLQATMVTLFGPADGEIYGRAADEIDRLNAQALELCAELSGLRRALAEAEALFVTGCGYIDDVPDGRAQYKDRVRAFLAATAKEGER